MLVVQAFTAIHAVQPNARLLFVGDGPLRKQLERSNANYIFAGMRRDEDLAAHYASADLFLFPSLTETFGNVTTEALASGLGVVAYDCAAAGELIRNGDNGRVVPSGDEALFISAAVELARNPKLLAALRQRAADSVRHLDWAEISGDLDLLLQETIHTHERQHRVIPTFCFAPD